MEYLFHLPVIAKVLGSLAVIVMFSRVFKHLSWPILMGIAFLAWLSGHDSPSTGRIVLDRFFDRNNLFLLVVVVQVIVLSEQMSRTGVMKELVRMVKAKVSQRASMAVLPAIIGFLPMPGGAIFSAPLVDDCDERKEIEPMLKTQINYWFRHIWEYGWPLYPGVLLAIEITRIDAWQFVLLQAPLSLVSIWAGTHFLLKRIPHNNTGDTKEGNGNGNFRLSGFLLLLLPILLIIASYTIIRIMFPDLSSFSHFIPMALGLILASSVLQCQHPLPKETWETILFSKSMMNMLLLVILIRIYGAFIETDLPDGVPLVEHMRSELMAFGISTFLAIMAIPFICGFTMGLAIGFVGASFPIVFSLLGPSPSLSAILSTTALAYAFGYMGMMLSPVHICLIVSNEHFKTQLLHSLKRLIKPALVILTAAILYSILLKLL